jgi:phage anti-repressor protein
MVDYVVLTDIYLYLKLFLMLEEKEENKTGSLAVRGRDLIPVEVINNEIMVDSRLLHHKLEIKTPHRKWMIRRIEDCLFDEGADFYTNLYESKGAQTKLERTNLSVQVWGGDRRSTGYMLTLDAAKELAMLEHNEVGKTIRRYFIEVEKQYRDWIGIKLPQLEKDVDLFSQRIGYDYVQLLRSVGCSTSKGAIHSRINKNRQEFWKSIRGDWFVSEDFGKTIIAYAIARRWSNEKKRRHLEYENQKVLQI